MRVLLVSANREHIPDPIFPLGLAYIAAATQHAGHETAVADLCFGRQPLARLRQQIQAFRPEVVGLSIRNVDTAAWPLTMDYLSQHEGVVNTVRAITNAPVVLGGSGFSILPGAFMQKLKGDFGISGEAEERFVALLNALENRLDPGNIPGILTRRRQHDAGLYIKPPGESSPQWNNGLHPARHSQPEYGDLYRGTWWTASGELFLSPRPRQRLPSK